MPQLTKLKIMDLKMLLLVFCILIASIILINTAIKMSFKLPEKRNRVSKFDRRSQLRNFGLDNAVRSRVNQYVESEMKYDDKRKKELLLKQAGSKMSITDLYIKSFLVAIVGSVVIGVLLKNIIAAVVFFVIGLYIPKNVLELKKNSRVTKLDAQIGVFIRTTVKRYYVTNKFVDSIEASMHDFDGLEPITSELKQTLSEIELGLPVSDALENMSKRTSSPYMKLFANNYKVAVNIGTQEMKEMLLDSVIEKYEKDIKIKSRLKREIKQPVIEGFLMMTIVPITFIMQSIYDREYIPFMIEKWPGKIALAATILLLALSAWLLICKVGAPLIKNEE